MNEYLRAIRNIIKNLFPKRDSFILVIMVMLATNPYKNNLKLAQLKNLIIDLSLILFGLIIIFQRKVRQMIYQIFHALRFYSTKEAGLKVNQKIHF